MATSWHLRDSTKRCETKAHLWRGASLLIDSRALEGKNAFMDCAFQRSWIDDPYPQYLAPEFELYRHLFMQQGIGASIANPRELEWRNGSLGHDNKVVDMAYNRLTDFYFDESAHQALRNAYTTGATVVTPNPHVHALRADKRNLTTLSNNERLAART